MERRRFVAAMGSALALPLLARAQNSRRVYRVGFLSLNPPQTFSHLPAALLARLGELGYVEGRNLVFDARHSEGNVERLPQVARELVAAKPDVIVTGINLQTRAARQATATIPIVMTVGTGVVEEGFAATLARPGGNITGLTWDVGIEVMPKRFEFLKEVVPGLVRVAVFWDEGQDTHEFKRAIEQGAASLGLRLIWVDFKEDLEEMFRIAAREKAQALFTAGGARYFRQRKRIAELAVKYRLPDTHYTTEFVEDGGLMSYAPNLADLFRRAGTYVDKILHGAKAADLPIERPVTLDLAINLKAAKAHGLTIPRALLVRADRVID